MSGTEGTVPPATEDVSRAAKIDTFTIETFFPGVEQKREENHGQSWLPPSYQQEDVAADDEKTLIIEHERNGQMWNLEIIIAPIWGTYELGLKPPSLPQGATVVWQPFEERKFCGTTWKEVGERSQLRDSTSTISDPLRVGVSVTVTYDNWRSKWDFRSEEKMANWDVAFLVNDKRFYAHRLVLSLVSTYFEKMFNGAFREKHEKEVPLEDVDPDLFEAFLHCVYPCGSDPPVCYLLPLTYLADKYGVESLAQKCHEALKWTREVSNVEKLQAAVKTTGPTLEDHVIDSLTAEDIKEVVESDVMKELGEERMAKILKKSATFI